MANNNVSRLLCDQFFNAHLQTYQRPIMKNLETHEKKKTGDFGQISSEFLFFPIKIINLQKKKTNKPGGLG